MSTKRVPIARPRRAQIVPEALDTFDEMKQLKCTCPEGADRDECPGCQTWWRLHSRLADLLPGLRPWDWPIIENPQAKCPYPEGSYAAARWRPNEKAEARWRELDAALAERKKPNALKR